MSETDSGLPRCGKGRVIAWSGPPQWLQENRGKLVFWVEAPPIVRGNDAVLRIVVETKVENPEYSSWTLVKVWLSQVVNRMKKGAMVCSTFGQRVWQGCGFNGFTRLADPGDFLELGVRNTPIRV